MSTQEKENLLGDLLLDACQKGNIDNVKYCISKGIKVDVKKNGPLKCASQYGNLEVIKFLVENGADLHYSNYDVLKNAAYWDHLDIVKYAVENGADIHTSDDYVLFHSMGQGHIDILIYLIEECDFDENKLYDDKNSPEALKDWINERRIQRIIDFKDDLEKSLDTKTEKPRKKVKL